MSKILILATAIVFAFSACGKDDTDNDDKDSDAGGAGASKGGTLEVSGVYDGTIEDGAVLKIAVFECPFSMPPKRFGEGTVDVSSGKTFGVIEEIEAGDWCFMAYIDMDTSDGLSPVAGLDPSSIASKSDGGTPFTVKDGQVTHQSVEYQIYSE